MNATELQRIRAKLEITQAEAAKRIGVDERTWRRWELSERQIPPPVAMLMRMIVAQGRV